MLTSLVLSLAVTHAPASGIHLDADPSLRTARLFAQAPPPLPVRPSDPSVAPVVPGGREAQLQADINAINDKLRGLKSDWPTVSVVMAYVGWSAAPLVLVGLLFMAIGGGLGVPVITLVGVVVLVLGIAGIALGIAGVVTGISASNAAKAERDELIRQRGELEGQLKALRAQPGAVDRSFESSPRLFTVAAF
jgi:hypothetical protein